MRSFIIIIGLLILPAMVYYQKTTEIKGVIISAENHQPLQDSHIYISGTNIGTISNEHGEFSLKVPMQYLDHELIVSYVGFSKYVKRINHIKPQEVQIVMQPDIIMLDEVVIIPKHQLMVKKVFEQVEKEYEDRSEMIEDFYYELIKRDHDLAILKKVVGEENLYGIDN